MGAQKSKPPDIPPELLLSETQVKRLLEAQRKEYERKRQEEAFITAQRKLKEAANTAAELRRNQNEVIIAAQRKLQEEAASIAAQRKLQEEAFITAQRELQKEAATLAAQRKQQEEAFIDAQRKLQEKAAKAATERKLQEEALIVAQRKFQEEAFLKAQRKLQEDAAIAVQSKRQEEAAKKELQEEAAKRKLEEEAANRKLQEEAAAKAAMQRKLQALLATPRKQHKKPFLTSITLQEEAAKRKHQEEVIKRELQEEAAKRAFQEETAKKKLQEEAAERKHQEESVKTTTQKQLQEESLIVAPRKSYKKPFLNATTLKEEAATRKHQDEASKRELQEEAANRKLQEEADKAAMQQKLQKEALIATPRKLHKKPFFTATTLQEEAARRKHQEEAAKSELQEEVKKRVLQEEAAKRKQQEEAAKKAVLEEAAKRKQQEEAAKKAFVEEAAKRKQQEEAARQALLEEAAKKAFLEVAAKRKQQEEAVKKAFQEEASTRPRELPREADVVRYCFTCYTRSVMKMFECENGHGSCSYCKIKGRACGICSRNLTNRTSYGNENHGAQTQVAWPHARQGCVLNMKIADMENHVQECPFKKLDCPVATVFRNCRWFGEISELSSHFADMHPNYLLNKLGSELHLRNMHWNYRYIRLVELGYHFIFHLKVSKHDGKILMAVQLIGTKINAMKWLYKIHVYNKSEDHRKYMYTDNCRSSIDDMDDVFRSGECAVLPMWYANTFFNNELTYKFFIKRTCENRRGSDRNHCGRDYSEEEEEDNDWSGSCSYIVYRRDIYAPRSPGRNRLET